MNTKFSAVYYKRSSRAKRRSKVPGEAEILALNPGRRDKIKSARPKWADVFAGTFNVKVDDSVYDRINLIKPVIMEDAKDVAYPPGFEGIPQKRNGYLYWKCRVYSKGKKMSCLWRAGRIRIDGIGELFAEKGIAATLGVSEGDTVEIKVYGEENPETAKKADVPAVKKEEKPEKPAVKLPFVDVLKDKWRGGHAFLICSGKSFNLLDKTPLKHCFTMGLNNSPKAMMPHFRPNIWTCVDGADKFLYTIWADPKIIKCVPDSHESKHLWNSDKKKGFDDMRVCDMPSVFLYPRNNVFNPETFLEEGTFNWGCGENVCGECGHVHPKEKDPKGKRIKPPKICPKCSAEGQWGARSVFFPAMRILYHLGFRNIYLLGVDFEMKEGDAKYSFAEDKTSSGVHGNNQSYLKMDKRFKKLRPVFEKHGLKVYNCNKESKLTAFDYLPYEEALAKALWFVDDWKKYVAGELEATEGLYQTKWFVCPVCGKDQRVSKEDVKQKKAKCLCGYVIDRRARKKYSKCRDKTDNC